MEEIKTLKKALLAGGKVTDFSGRPWEKLEAYGPQTLATNGKIHPEMLKIIRTLIKKR